MPKLFALTWRVLLAVALVCNPVAAGIAMAGEGVPAMKAQGAAKAAEMPSCHDMAMAADAAANPAGDGKDRSHPACQFGACCLLLSMHVSRLHMPAVEHRGLAPLVPLPDAAKAPPAVRMIRPPIA